MYFKRWLFIFLFLLLIVPLVLSQQDCEILDVQWMNEEGEPIFFAHEGDSVVLAANTKNCQGFDAVFSVINFKRYSPETGLPEGDVVANFGPEKINTDQFAVVWKAEVISGLAGADPKYLFYVGIMEGEEFLNFKEVGQMFPVFKRIEEIREIEVIDSCGDGICDPWETPETCPEDCLMIVDDLGKVGIYTLIGLIVFLLAIGGFVAYKYVKKKEEKK